MLLHVELASGGRADGKGATVLETRPLAVEVRRARRAPKRPEPRLNRVVEEPLDDPDDRVGELSFGAGLLRRRAVLLDVVV